MTLPEPLRRTAKLAVEAMLQGVEQGVVGPDLGEHNFGLWLITHRPELVVAMALEAERLSGETRSVRLLAKEAHPDGPSQDANKYLLYVVLCDAGRPDQPISIQRSTDTRYLIEAPIVVLSTGVSIARR